jgi:type IV pilus assembly protein PilE
MQTKLEKTMSPRGQIGVTLIELLVVVVILAIITAVSYPSYVQYIVDTKRTAATSVLLQVADKQQQFFMDNKSYSADLTNLGFPSNPQEISDDGQVMAAGISQNVYSVALSNVAATTYTITATPLNTQLSRDAECGALTLDQSGARGAGGDVGDCWR